jgi:hypothetical protein
MEPRPGLDAATVTRSSRLVALRPAPATVTHVPRPRPALPDDVRDDLRTGPLSGLPTSTGAGRSPELAAAQPVRRTRRRPTVVVVPLVALAGLVVIGTSAFLPWRVGGAVPVHGVVGVVLLAVIAGLGVAAAVDLVTGRLRTTGLVALPTVVALAALGAGAIAAVAAGTGLTEPWGLSTGLDGLGPLVLLAGLVVTTVGGCVAVLGFVRGWGADATTPASRSPRRAAVVAAAVVGAFVLIGAAGVVLATAGVPHGPPPIAGGDPATFVGGTGVLGGALPSAAAVVVAVGGAMPTAPCPAVAQSTLPETAGAVLVGRSASLAVSVCQGASGRLYYFGANPDTRVTVTLPAARTASAWTATDNALTYVITETQVSVERDGAVIAGAPMTGGW